MSTSTIYYRLFPAPSHDLTHTLKNTKQEPHVRRNGDIPHPLGTQEREFHQARLLLALFLLLPLPVCGHVVRRTANLRLSHSG